MNNKPLTAVIVGYGHRSVVYANYSLSHPERLKIVGVADPDEKRRLAAAKRFGFSPEFCFENAEELAKKEKFADAVINGTMDHQHFETAVPLLEKGYDMLLEKPFSVSKDEMKALMAVINRNKNKVMICHVLRYAPFYREIRKRILAGEIGDILNIQTTEHVSFHHLSTSYVRGKWANYEKCKTSMLLAKSCHDIDIMMWMMQPVLPVSVSSVGSIFQFKPENAPENAGTRCTKDCPLVDTCRYSSKKMYLQHPDAWTFYVWAALEHKENITDEDRLNEFRNGSDYDRCIYKCDNNVVDHQSVLINFSNGATGTHNMIGGTAKSMRRIHIVGTKGEIYGELDDGKFTVSKIKTEEECYYTDEVVDVSVTDDSHGGGDEALVEDFITYVQTGEQSVSSTAIENSVAGHLTVFNADESREHGGEIRQLDFSEYC